MNAAFIGGVLTVLILAYRKSPISLFTGRNLFLRHFADKDGHPLWHCPWNGWSSRLPNSPLMMWALERLSGN